MKNSRQASESISGPDDRHTVIVLDDDREVGLAVASLMRSVRLPCLVFDNPRELLRDREALDSCACLVLDLRMPIYSGLDVQARLKKMGYRMPIIFLSGHGTIPTALRAIRAGALDFIEKPFNDHVLLDQINKALRAKEGVVLAEDKEVRLTPRERDVAEGILRDQTSAQTAEQLGISPRTVDVHRSRLFRRLGVRRSSEALPLISALLKDGRRRAPKAKK